MLQAILKLVFSVAACAAGAASAEQARSSRADVVNSRLRVARIRALHLKGRPLFEAARPRTPPHQSPGLLSRRVSLAVRATGLPLSDQHSAGLRSRNPRRTFRERSCKGHAPRFPP